MLMVQQVLEGELKAQMEQFTHCISDKAVQVLTDELNRLQAQVGTSTNQIVLIVSLL